MFFGEFSLKETAREPDADVSTVLELSDTVEQADLGAATFRDVLPLGGRDAFGGQTVASFPQQALFPLSECRQGRVQSALSFLTPLFLDRLIRNPKQEKTIRPDKIRMAYVPVYGIGHQDSR